VPDQFTETGEDDELRRKYGLTVEDIMQAAERVVKLKS